VDNPGLRGQVPHRWHGEDLRRAEYHEDHRDDGGQDKGGVHDRTAAVWRMVYRSSAACAVAWSADEDLIRTRVWWLELGEPHHLRAAVAVILKAVHEAYSFEISVA
jgi:hypothetical protein